MNIVNTHVALKSLNYSKFQFTHLWNGDNNTHAMVKPIQHYTYFCKTSVISILFPLCLIWSYSQPPLPTGEYYKKKLIQSSDNQPNPKFKAL